MSKIDLSEKLAEDYAEIASSRSVASFNEAYDHYYERCMKRTFEDLYAQCKVQGLDISKRKLIA